MNTKCLHRFTDGTYCKRWAARGARFCAHHNPEPVHIRHHDGAELHPLARLTTPEDVFDLIRETLNAARLGRISPTQANSVVRLANLWFKSYFSLSVRQRETGLHRQMLPDLVETELQLESDRVEQELPLPVRIDERAAVEQLDRNQESQPPPEPLSSYPGWAERYGPKASRKNSGNGSASSAEVAAASANPPNGQAVAAAPAQSPASSSG